MWRWIKYWILFTETVYSLYDTSTVSLISATGRKTRSRAKRSRAEKVESSEHRATVILNSIYRVKGLYKITALREISKRCLETKQSIRRLRCITVYWGVSMYRVSCSPTRSEHRWREKMEFNKRHASRWSNFLLSLMSNPKSPSCPANFYPATCPL